MQERQVYTNFPDTSVVSDEQLEEWGKLVEKAPIKGNSRSDFIDVLSQLSSPLDANLVTSWQGYLNRPHYLKIRDKTQLEAEQSLKEIWYWDLTDRACEAGNFKLADRILSERMVNIDEENLWLGNSEEFIDHENSHNARLAIKHGDVELAHEYLDRISDEIIARLALRNMSDSALQNGRLTLAYKYLNEINLLGGFEKNSFAESDFTRNIVNEIVKRGKLDLARRVELKLSDSSTNFDLALYTETITQLVEEEKFEEALDLAKTIQNPNAKFWAYSLVGRESEDISLLKRASVYMRKSYPDHAGREELDDMASEIAHGYLSIAKKLGFKHDASKYKQDGLLLFAADHLIEDAIAYIESSQQPQS